MITIGSTNEDSHSQECSNFSEKTVSNILVKDSSCVSNALIEQRGMYEFSVTPAVHWILLELFSFLCVQS